MQNETWYYCTNDRFTFAFCLQDGRVTRCAPCMYKKLIGKTEEISLQLLRNNGYDVLHFQDEAHS